MSTKTHIYNDTIKMFVSFVKRAGLWELIMMVVRHFFARRIISRLPKKTFTFKGERLDYFYHKYNITWITERAIEVPVGKHYLQTAGEANTLEVGNVLSHYIEAKHVIIDKFESGRTVVNEDILEYKPSRKFDLIISISTFEHIGYEDDVPDPEKVAEAIKACQRLLNPGGKLVITVPMGYNENLDRYLRENRVAPDVSYYFEKVDKTTWQETTKESALARKYCRPFPYANAILVAEFSAQ